MRRRGLRRALTLRGVSDGEVPDTEGALGSIRSREVARVEAALEGCAGRGERGLGDGVVTGEAVEDEGDDGASGGGDVGRAEAEHHGSINLTDLDLQSNHVEQGYKDTMRPSSFTVWSWARATAANASAETVVEKRILDKWAEEGETNIRARPRIEGARRGRTKRR